MLVVMESFVSDGNGAICRNDGLGTNANAIGAIRSNEKKVFMLVLAYRFLIVI